MDELQKVDGAVQERGFEFLLEVDVGLAGLSTLHVLRDVDERDNVDGELAEDGANNVEVEDVVLGTFFGEAFDRLIVVSNASRENCWNAL